MATKVGVGESKRTDSFEAGSEAARIALNRAGIDKCNFVFLHATAGYNQPELLMGVRSITGDTPLSGCSGEGIITQAGPEGEVIFTQAGTKKGIDAAGVMVISSDEIKFVNYAGKDLKYDSKKAGEKIGRKIVKDNIEKPRVLMMYLDGLTVNVKEFFHGIDTVVQKPLVFCGGLAADDFTYSNTYQYHNDHVLSDAASCVLISGDAKIELGVSHGCYPIGLEKTITKRKSNTVYEINHEPIWSFFKQYLDPDMEEFNNEVNTFIGLGEILSQDLTTEYDNHIIRSPVSQNPDGSLNFATEIDEGTHVHLIRRDADKISMNAKKVAERIKARLGDKKPIAVLHIDCSGRGKMFFGNDVKEKGINVIQNVLGKDIPWLGFYSYGEISPIKNINYFHNHTVVLCVIYK